MRILDCHVSGLNVNRNLSRYSGFLAEHVECVAFVRQLGNTKEL